MQHHFNHTQALGYIVTDADYEKAELDQLKDALKQSYKERFMMATTLYKIHQTMKKAKIVFKR